MEFFGKLKRIFVGRALRNEQAIHQRLSKKVALAVFSSDALSSTAYASEEILLVLAVAVAFGSTMSFAYLIPISIAIACLLILVTVSYRQTVFAYPSGGGAYIVAKENLGQTAGLTAAASLLVDYVLTVSVSIAAGVAALTSAAQGTSLEWISDHRVAIAIGLVLFICAANLRGVRESGSFFATPTYIFLFSFLFMIGFGLVRYLLGNDIASVPDTDLKLADGYAPQAISVFLILAAFSNGCAALTGIEAISNGVMAFKKPEAKNAATTLIVMAILLCTMFLGTSVLAYLYGVQPSENETVISQFGRIVFSGSFAWLYYVVQFATAAILILAANTAFADFPRLSSLLARDRYIPRQFSNRGDKLVFSNGIVILAILSSLLLIVFAGDTSRLIPLYAVGVFLSFTLSQTGMVRHWWKMRDGGESGDAGIHSSDVESERAIPDIDLALEQSASRKVIGDEADAGKNWKRALAINLIGAIATGAVLIVFVVTKFAHGAWLVVVTVPLLVFVFRIVHGHYVAVARQLSLEEIGDLAESKRNTVIVPISGVHRGVIRALQYASSIAPGNVTAVYVDFEDEGAVRLKERWDLLRTDVKLVILPSPYRELTRPLLRFIQRMRHLRADDTITIVIPEFVPKRWWQHLLHNQSSLLLKAALLFKENIIVTNIPYHLQ